MAAQPPRPPPRNLLFCGPPALPPVILLPADPAPPSAYNLQQINNVGVPYDNVLAEQTDYDSQKYLDQQNLETHSIDKTQSLRRTQSFDTADVYESAPFEFGIDTHALKIRRSEPDLSRYGLFLEAEVTVECAPMQPPPLVLNNPFYDSSYAIGAEQAMVMLPENYLAFEDSFVPSWDYKSNVHPDTGMHPDMYYESIPILQPNDPWTAYGNDYAAFEYYAPQYNNPHEVQNHFSYIPLTDLEYAIPQYMSLPVIEQAKVENYNPDVSDSAEVTSTDLNNTSETTEQVESTTEPKSTLVTDEVSTNVSEVTTDYDKEDDKVSSNRESRTQSEESLNADISCDVTSSLAFVPCSKSSQIAHGADDTSDDTSPCSTDYHEASALDLAQSLEELSCCDSTDFSQSRDDLSPPPPPESTTPLNTYETEKQDAPDSNKNIPLSELPSIPHHERIPRKLPPIPDYVVHKESPAGDSNSSVLVNEITEGVEESAINADLGAIEQTGNEQIKTKAIEQTIEVPSKRWQPTEVEQANSLPKDLPIQRKEPPHPPAVPESWLTKPQETQEVFLSPQLCVQDPDGVTIQVQPSAQTPKVVNTTLAVEPQPSCSFVPQEPAVAQLTPDGPREVEVRHSLNYVSCF